MHRTWREGGLCKIHKEVRVLEPCKGEGIDSCMVWEREGTVRRWSEQAHFTCSHPVASSDDGSAVLRGQVLTPQCSCRKSEK